jgi:hypothetical protein
MSGTVLSKSSDEPAFRCGRGKVYVTRRPEEKYLQACCVLKFKDFACVYIGACIGGDGSKGPLFIWERKKIGNICSSSYSNFQRETRASLCRVELHLIQPTPLKKLCMREQSSQVTLVASQLSRLEFN